MFCWPLKPVGSGRSEHDEMSATGNEWLICSALFVVLTSRPAPTAHGECYLEKKTVMMEVRVVCTSVDERSNSHRRNFLLFGEYPSVRVSWSRAASPLVSERLTFVVDEEGVRRQRVLVVGDVLQDVSQVHVHPDHAQQQVAEVTGPADGHNKTWKKREKLTSTIIRSLRPAGGWCSKMIELHIRFHVLLLSVLHSTRR